MISSLSRSRSDIILILSSIAMLIASNFFRIPLPGLSAPLTLQTFCVITSAIVLPRSVLLPTLIGYFLLTMTAFNPHGFGVIPITFGYIVGMATACYYLSSYQTNSLFNIVLAYALPLVFGTAYLCLFIPFSLAIQTGLIPFIGVEAIKALLTFKLACQK